MEMRHPSFRAFLQAELLRRSKANPRYSLRAFAKALQMDHSTLVKVLSGKRTLGPRAITKVATRLGLAPAEVSHFTSVKTDEVDANYRQLTLDSFAVISDWYHYAILELMRSDGFRPDPHWMARVLGILPEEAKTAIERLKRLGLIEVDPTGRWYQPDDARATTLGNPFTARAFRNLQKQILEKAITALEEVPMDQRDQTSMTMAIDVSLLPEAKKRIAEFRRGLAAFLSRGERRDEVYHLSLSLYPVSQIRSETQFTKGNQ